MIVARLTDERGEVRRLMGERRQRHDMTIVAPGARTAWHTRPNGQTIYVTEGVGRCPRRGRPMLASE